MPTPNRSPDQLTEPQRKALRILGGYVKCATDGSNRWPTDPKRSRAGWAVHYAEDHPWNALAPLDGPLQDSYRAELRAAAHVIFTAVIPTWIFIDNLSVADQLHNAINDPTWRPTHDHDIWDIVILFLRDTDQQFFKVTWIPSHTDDPKKAHIRTEWLKQERGTPEDFTANDAADRSADTAAGLHTIPTAAFNAIDHAIHLAQLTMTMLTTINQFNMNEFKGKSNPTTTPDEEYDEDPFGFASHGTDQHGDDDCDEDPFGFANQGLDIDGNVKHVNPDCPKLHMPGWNSLIVPPDENAHPPLLLLPSASLPSASHGKQQARKPHA